ncbi:MAG: class I SAM-dependent methyltransferase [Nitrososphaerota archaeon]|nr:class I SAM-dependent methyltransferase [Nitrososphaerota archaeon]
MIAQHFPKDKQAKILEIGCGHGAILYFAKGAGYMDVRGVDASAEQVEAAKRLGIENVELGDAMETLRAQKDSSVDCMISFDVIEHFDRNELLDLVDEVHRSLRAGGKWIIHTVNAESPFGMRIRYGDLTHELAFTRTSIGQLLLSSGFKKVSSFEDSPVAHGLKSAVRWGVWMVMRRILRFYLAVETGDTAKDAILTQNFLTVAVK